jgi:hypothetical protein
MLYQGLKSNGTKIHGYRLIKNIYRIISNSVLMLNTSLELEKDSRISSQPLPILIQFLWKKRILYPVRNYPSV